VSIWVSCGVDWRRRNQLFIPAFLDSSTSCLCLLMRTSRWVMSCSLKLYWPARPRERQRRLSISRALSSARSQNSKLMAYLRSCHR